ncbi:MAG: serine hydrolase [Pyrinomonadaceae bacterium]
MRRIVSILVLVLYLVSVSAAQAGKKVEIALPKGYKAPAMSESAELKKIVDEASLAAMAQFKTLKPEEFAITIIDLRDGKKFEWAQYRGEERIYPASVVKMFYLAAIERQLEDKKVTMTKELERGLHDMIVDSSNEATQYILDVLTDTSSGAELPQKQFEEWQYKRNRANRWFSSMGYTNINVNQKTFCEDAYGIEQQSRNYKGQNRNMITTNATARVLAEIVTGNLNTPERTAAMMNLLKRDPFTKSDDPNSQSVNFTGKLLIDRKMTDAKLWSKAGWTSKARHDAAYIETGDGLKFVIAVYTENHANEFAIIPAIAGKVLDGMHK